MSKEIWAKIIQTRERKRHYRHTDYLNEQIAQLKTELAKLKKELKIAICMFCGKKLPRNMEDKEKQAEILVDHIYECPNHPIVKLQEELAAKDKALRKYGTHEMCCINHKHGRGQKCICGLEQALTKGGG